MGKKLTTETKNKAFWAKSKPAQRVAVAKDVLKNIELKFYKATTGEYFSIEALEEDIKVKDAPKQFNETIGVLRDKGAYCDVCGIGSCFVSLVNLGNNITTSHVVGTNTEIYQMSIGDSKMRPLLRKVFEPSQLSLIEQAFEMEWHYSDGEDMDDGENTGNAVRFGEKYKTDKGRLIAIMNNIIKNKGTFIP